MTTTTPLRSEPNPNGAWQRLAAVAAAADALAAEVRGLTVEAREALAEVPNDVTLAAERIESAKQAVAAVARLRHAAASLQVFSVELADRSEVKARDAERSTRQWVARHAGLSPSEAGASLRAASMVRRFPTVAEALCAGDITPAHAEAMANIVLDHFRGARKRAAQQKMEQALEIILREARESAVSAFRAFCVRVRDLLDEDGAPDRSADPSRISIRQGFNGRWILQGDLEPDFGALVATLLEAQAEANRRAEQTRKRAERAVGAEGEPHVDGDGEANGDPAVEGEGEVDGVGAADGESAGEADDEPRPHSERLAEALAQLLAAGAAAGRPGKVGIFLHIELADLLGGKEAVADLVASTGKAHTELGLDLSDEALWGLMCGSLITPVLNLEGTPLSYGRTRRLSPEVLTHILRHRDRTCTFPNCDIPGLRLRMHHVIYWDDGGTTDPGNIRGTCNGHHHDIHDRGWRVEQDAGGQVRVFRPDGTQFDPTPHYRRQQDSDKCAGE